jgi:hypothetical protein
MHPIHQHQPRRWAWQLLTHARLAEALLFLFALGVIVDLASRPH